MYNIEQISRGVSLQRIEEYKQKTETEQKSLKLKKIIWICFTVSLAVLFFSYRIFG